MKTAKAIGSREFYKSYSEKMKVKGLKAMPYSKYFMILKAMGNVYQEHIKETGIVGLPHGLGDVMVISRRRAPIVTTLTKTKQFGTRTLFNDHSDGVVKKIYWSSPEIKKRKGKTWLFSPCRSLKRGVSFELFAGKAYPDYLKILKA